MGDEDDIDAMELDLNQEEIDALSYLIEDNFDMITNPRERDALADVFDKLPDSEGRTREDLPR